MLTGSYNDNGVGYAAAQSPVAPRRIQGRTSNPKGR